jgi:hypothetical protein
MPRKSILMLVVLVLSLVGSLVSVGVWAQTERRRSDPTAITVAPQVFSGESIGVRVTGPPDRNGRIPGALVVKINGDWVEVKSSPTVVSTIR